MELLTKSEVVALNPNVNNVWAVRRIVVDTSKLPSTKLPDVEGFLISEDAPEMPEKRIVEHTGFRVGTSFSAKRVLDEAREG